MGRDGKEYVTVKRGAKQEDVRLQHLFHLTRAVTLHANANRSSEIDGAGHTRLVTPGSLSSSSILQARAVPVVLVPVQSALPDPTCLAIEDDLCPPSRADADCVVVRVEGRRYPILPKTEPVQPFVSPPPAPPDTFIDTEIEPAVEQHLPLVSPPPSHVEARIETDIEPFFNLSPECMKRAKKRPRHGCTVYGAIKATRQKIVENYGPAGQPSKGSSRRNAVPCPNPKCGGLVSIKTGRHAFGCLTPQNQEHPSQYMLCLKKVRCLKKAKHAGLCIENEWPAYEEVRKKMLEDAVWAAAITKAEAAAGVAPCPQPSPSREEGAVAAYCRARDKVPGPEQTDDDEDD